ncbi:MAG: hypothetical protein K0R76_186 [Alphaproteobacteria bacterium]|jgi:uncharacterized protein YcbK (DUF882 family)|nr:hypothetical protein [Alphaproteobacteria bacterium]
MAHKTHSLVSEKAETGFSRRAFLKVVGSTSLSVVAAPTLMIPKSFGRATALTSLKEGQDLFLSFYNCHTGESLKKCAFWAGGSYDSQALKEINKLFRDHRTNMIHEIDCNLLHVLYKIQKQLGTIEPFHLISGYRSPKSNKMMNAHSRGVAKNSQHIYGKAADIYVPGRTLKQIQGAAKSLRAGGVGRYTGFVHVDTGRIRYWGAA